MENGSGGSSMGNPFMMGGMPGLAGLMGMGGAGGGGMGAGVNIL